MFHPPSFNLSDLFWASVDYLSGNWLPFLLLCLAVIYLIARGLYTLAVYLERRARRREGRAAFNAMVEQLAREDRARNLKIVAARMRDDDEKGVA